MSNRPHHGGWVILLSFIVSYGLAIMPLPDWAVYWKPDWVGMVLLYWCIALPERVNVGTGWLVGILHDILSDTLLGMHAISYTLLAYLAVEYHRQVRVFPRWQQSMWVFIVILGSEGLGVWIRGMQGYPQPGWMFAYPAVTSMFLWYWVFVGLRDLRRHFRVR
jgi:rod shape-determining protein MreD